MRTTRFTLWPQVPVPNAQHLVSNWGGRRAIDPSHPLGFVETAPRQVAWQADRTRQALGNAQSWWTSVGFGTPEAFSSMAAYGAVPFALFWSVSVSWPFLPVQWFFCPSGPWRQATGNHEGPWNHQLWRTPLKRASPPSFAGPALFGHREQHTSRASKLTNLADHFVLLPELSPVEEAAASMYHL